MREKSLIWLGSALEDLRAFPDAARREAGFQLGLVQDGEMPDDFKTMRSVGAGVYEIRVRTSGHAHRVFYVAKFDEAVYVLHAFEKKTQKTATSDLETGRRRYALLLNQRTQR